MVNPVKLTVGITILVSSVIEHFGVFAQSPVSKNKNGNTCRPATLVIYRTFNVFEVGFNYKLFVNDSMVGRIKTGNVYIVELETENASIFGKTSAEKQRALNFKLQPGKVYFVKCGLRSNVFDLPRRPSFQRMISKRDIEKSMKKKSLRRKLKRYLLHEWLNEMDFQK